MLMSTGLGGDLSGMRAKIVHAASTFWTQRITLERSAPAHAHVAGNRPGRLG
jgi:hypothetical protein